MLWGLVYLVGLASRTLQRSDDIEIDYGSSLVDPCHRPVLLIVVRQIKNVYKNQMRLSESLVEMCILVYKCSQLIVH